MKKILNGKMYNTETAEEISYYSYGCGHSDFHWYEESLYKKKTGEFFLAGEGGPLSHYAEACPSGGCSYGSRVEPLTIDEAKKWLEEYGDADTYIRCFGEPEE